MLSQSVVSLLLSPTSEVFACDLRRGDVVVAAYPDDTPPTLLQVLTVDLHPSVAECHLVRWARVLDLDELHHDERVQELRAQGHRSALDMSQVVALADVQIVNVVGRDIRR